MTNAYLLSHLSDAVLLRNTSELVARDRVTTAELLAHIAEVDARKLYLPAAYPSMFAWCVGELRLSEDAAYKRIQAARIARLCPAILSAVADGRLHLTGVGMLAPYLTTENADGLLRAAAYKSKAEIELLLAERFPRSEMLPLVEVIPSGGANRGFELAPGQVAGIAREGFELAPAQVGNAALRSKVAPIASQRFALHLSVGQSAHDKLRHAQALLSHQIPSGDLAEVFERALDALIREAEKEKFAATSRPQRTVRPSKSARHIPSRVKRAVRERDQDQCTFTSESGKRCGARSMLEFDHVEEVARGGRASVAGVRLRCGAHNQYTAECTFGREFMDHKREAARAAAAASEVLKAREMAMARAEAAAREVAKLRAEADAAARVKESAAAEAAAAAERAKEQDVVPWLRELGIRAEEARRVAKLCEAIPDAPLNERVRYALSCTSTRARLAHTPMAPAG